MFQGRKCTETKSEQSPWWTVDLLSVQVMMISHKSFQALSCSSCYWRPTKYEQSDILQKESLSLISIAAVEGFRSLCSDRGRLVGTD